MTRLAGNLKVTAILQSPAVAIGNLPIGSRSKRYAA
jgi:hypothetical protein